MLENTEGAIKNGQSRDTDNIYWVQKTQKQTNKNTTQYVMATTICKQIQITYGKQDMSPPTNNWR